MEHIAELFNTARVDFFWHSQQHGITDTPLSKHTLATCTLFRLLLTGSWALGRGIWTWLDLPRVL